MALSTPGSRIPKWRSLLRNAYLTSFDGHTTHTIEEIQQAITKARQSGVIKATCTFAVDKSFGIHPHQGVPQLYFDQLNVIAKHLHDIQQETQQTQQCIRTARATQTANVPQSQPTEPIAQSFKLAQLKKREDWPEWRQSRFTMLDQYQQQGMFSDPMPLPQNANALHMLWTYVLKVCGTRKSRLVCNGNPRQKGTITLGHTYANALDAASERLFWSIVAKEGLIAVGADVSNAFAEAPPPTAPLYLYIDDAFREWWTDHLGKPPIPKECNVVRVHNAIQGHPESPRLWEKHIDKILRNIGLQPTVHEPCLYSGTINGNRVIFLRQVDDFAVAALTIEIAQTVIDQVNQKMRIDIKNQGTIERFNGVDIHQTRHYVKLTCEKYLYKMLKNHGWLTTEHTPNTPTPLPQDTKYITAIENATIPKTESERQALKDKMGFNYRQVIGELIYPMMKCRPDISFHTTKLSQYMENPAEIHYQALRHICSYLAATIYEGIYYWRDIPRMDLPEAPNPKTFHDNYTVTIAPTDHRDFLFGYVDADWASDTTHRKSVTGIALMYAGGTIGYKTKYQDTIAHSSTEAEFTAACDAAKMILFFRSILADLGIKQPHATILYEDNHGALLMANAQQPTRRTRHLDIKKFALLDWVEQDLLILRNITTSDNAADTFTKSLGKQLFYRHIDTIMGRRVPTLLRSNQHSSCLKQPTNADISYDSSKHGGGKIRT